jgi:dipeptidase D
MSSDIRQLQPMSLWNRFADINAIPRPSKKEDRIIAFARSFGEKLGLPTEVDAVGNVIIRKPATVGMENRKKVVLQSHLDMVCQKNAGTSFDFDTEGIRMKVQGDWVMAEGTTLGADNGIGVAAIMAVLEANDIAHPELEALFTIDEETGMTGALALQPGQLQGEIMLNLDTEEDKELTIGCAGGVDVSTSGSYQPEVAEKGLNWFALSVKGAQGGHSGMDIHLGRANANKLMNRILWALQNEASIRISSIDGGGLRNAIPRESFAIISCTPENKERLLHRLGELRDEILAEYATTDASLQILAEEREPATTLLATDFQRLLLSAIYACPNGIYRMSPDIAGLVQSSNNLARVFVSDGQWTIQCLTRSALESEKEDLVEALSATFTSLGGRVEKTGAYPGWAPKPHSDIVNIMASLHVSLFNDKANVMACHAGLECGIIGKNYPGMDMISFGPNILGAHSPDERVQVSSVQKFWKYLLATLERIPEKSN